MRPTPFLALTLLVVACNSAAPESQAHDAERPWRQPGDVIDSILPMEEYIARFRIGTREVTTLGGGAPSREELAQRVLAAASSADTAALVSLLVTRGEFAWLVFPDHLYRAPPYELDPAILWLQMSAETQKGLSRLLRELGGRALAFRSLACERDTLVLTGGPATLYRDCAVRYVVDDSTRTRRLFGSIYERDGSHKLMGFSNDF